MVRISSNLLFRTLIVCLVFSGDAFAHGGISGGLSAAYFIYGLLLGVVAFILLVTAFILKKYYKKTGAALICVVLVTIVVLLELFSFSRPIVFGAINPWYGSDALIMSILTMTLILGLLLFVFERWKIRLVIIFVTFGVVIFEACITPHARIFYPNQPLTGEIITIRPYDCRYFGLPDGRILHIADQCVKTGPRDSTLLASISGATNAYGEKVYRISLRTEKSYLVGGGIKKSDKWKLRNPFVAKYETVYAGEGKILEDDWQATGEMLSGAAGGYNYSMEWVKEVIKHGADINVKKYGYGGLLYSAVVQNDYELARVLVEAGRDVNMKSNGQTPLHLAANKNHKMTKLLLDHGADMNLLDGKGLKAMDITMASLKYASTHTRESYEKERLAELQKIEEVFLNKIK